MIDFLGNLAVELGDSVWSVASGVIGWLFGLLADLILVLSAALPDGGIWELPEVAAQWETGLGWLNWWLPIGQIAAALAVWAAATVAYYTFQYILKHIHR